MIIVETPVRSIEFEMDALAGVSSGPNTQMYVLGAMQALRWIKDGATPPSFIDEVVGLSFRGKAH
jgi:hypothetical protein